MEVDFFWMHELYVVSDTYSVCIPSEQFTSHGLVAHGLQISTGATETVGCLPGRQAEWFGYNGK